VQIVRDHPGQFGLFAALPLPDTDGALAEIGYAFDTLGAAGVIVETNAHGVYLGDQRLEPVFAELVRRRATVMLHPTSPPCWQQTALGRPRPIIEFIFDTARAVTDLILAGTLIRHPAMSVIVPHSGGALPLLADRIKAFMFASPPHGAPEPDPVAQLHRLYYDLAGTPFPRQVPALLNLVSPSQLLYGSDFCFTPALGIQMQIAAINAAPVPVEGATWQSLTTTPCGCCPASRLGRPPYRASCSVDKWSVSSRCTGIRIGRSAFCSQSGMDAIVRYRPVSP
jgi:6-methylsalicylate decarboxylase